MVKKVKDKRVIRHSSEVRNEGICPGHELASMTRSGIITAPPVKDGQIQPASIDLRLGGMAFRMKTGFLPRPTGNIPEIIKRYAKYDIPLGDKSILLEKGQGYLIELEEGIDLPEGFFASMNPKSTTGRTDVFTRVLADGIPAFDSVGSTGRRSMYVECIPRSFDIRVNRGLALGQMRIGYHNSAVSERELKLMQAQPEEALMFNLLGRPLPINMLQFNDSGIDMTVDLQSPIVAYRAKTSPLTPELDLTKGRGSLAEKVEQYWEPIARPGDGELVLEKGYFYLLATREKIRFPASMCGTLRAYDVTSAEGRIHYAGFFDPGFFAPATLEVRVDENFLIVDGQRICNMRFERMATLPRDKKGKPIAYGEGVYGSNYQGQQGPTLGKQFLPKLN